MNAFAWLLRREVWEHRALWLVPAISGAVVIVITLLVISMADVRRNFDQTGAIIQFREISESRDAINKHRENIDKLQVQLDAELAELDRLLPGQPPEEPPAPPVPPVPPSGATPSPTPDPTPAPASPAPPPGGKDTAADVERRAAELERRLEAVGREMESRAEVLVEKSVETGDAEMAGHVVALTQHALELAGKAIQAEGNRDQAALQAEIKRLEQQIERDATAFSGRLVGVIAGAMNAAGEGNWTVEVRAGLEQQQQKIERLQEQIQREAEAIQKQTEIISKIGGVRIENDDVSIELSKLNLGYLVESFALADANKQREWVQGALLTIAIVFFLFTLFVISFYSLDALYGERKDKTALFWKSMPVSDTQTVVSKFTTALVTAPAFSLAMVLAVHVFLLVTASILVWYYDKSAWDLVWANAALASTWFNVLFVYFLQSLWFFPLVGWLLLVSASVRRSPFLVAVLVPIVLVLLERWIFGSEYLLAAVQSRFLMGEDGSIHLDLAGLDKIGEHGVVLTSLGAPFRDPALWFGLVVGGLFAAATVWVRRYRDEY
ncbi:MAG: hypothetical protein LJE84_08495 [Gammaproteobacteria bacterium]|nr:hypothetical protein [Gammaproteobacteria bacterium]